MWGLLPILLLCHHVLAREVREDHLVNTSLGLIRGLVSEDGRFTRFLGIPYAVVDEENPFAESIPSLPFNDTFNAFDGSGECPQNWRGNLAGELQCLKVNVHVPNTASSQNLRPVMVYIHGGAFSIGSGGSENPDKLLSHDIVYVSINYRLGIYGFMCTDSPKAPGNAGLKDQLTALRWINENIEAFGGDKNKITVFGSSAGGMSIHLHLLSPFEKVFDQAIIQSGPSTSPFTMIETNNDVPLKMAEYLGFVTEDVEQAIDFIAKVDVDQALIAGGQLEPLSAAYSREPLTKPCVEKKFDGKTRFIEVNPNDAIPEKAKTTNVMIGYCSQEMKFFYSGGGAAFFDSYVFQDLLQFGFNVSNFDDNVNTLRHFYIGDNAPSWDVANELTTFASDFVFNHPLVRAVDAMVKVGPKAVYQYMFSYDQEGSTSALDGVSHSAELRYLFSTGEATVADQLTSDRVTTLWTNFVKYGDPTPETTELLPVKWEPLTQDSVPYLDIAKELTLPSRPFHDRMAFWDLFFEQNKERTNWYLGDN